MEAYNDQHHNLWDFTSPAASTAAPTYHTLNDADFMSFLDKQYQGVAAQNHQNHHDLTLQTFSEQVNQNKAGSSSREPTDSPSPNGSPSEGGHFDEDAPAPKRKATDEAQDGPSSKTQHTMKTGSSSSSSTATSGRRKSTGNAAKDESRLLKRKEQNRAAQRAFRERKEKHVRDLEDKVAQLEAKNDEALHENENLRDLLTRLQTENVMLKQGQFTFSMPRDNMQSFPTDLGAFAPAARFPSPTAKSPKASSPLDWSSLTTFDPARLNLLDENQGPTATDSAMHLDFGFGGTPGLAPNTPFTTLASNPVFMSFASSFDGPETESPNLASSPTQPFSFDINSLTSWPTQPAQEGNLDDLLTGYLVPNNNLDFSFLTSPASASPVTHHLSPTEATLRSISTSTSSSSPSTDQLFTPKDSPEGGASGEGHDGTQCPKTKAELVKRIEECGPSPFGPTCQNPGVRKSSDGVLSMISCEGATSFPKTQKSEQNVEVLSAWRSITSNPKFKVRPPGRNCEKGH